jgi:hypothetical protein
MGREEEQDLMGRSNRGLREDCGGCLQPMKAADLNRFLVVCALVSDLYCPGYNPRQPLAKDANLARTAVRYKIDSAKVVTAVRAELSKPTNNLKRQTESIKKIATATGHGSVRKRST